MLGTIFLNSNIYIPRSTIFLSRHNLRCLHRYFTIFKTNQKHFYLIHKTSSPNLGSFNFGLPDKCIPCSINYGTVLVYFLAQGNILCM